jgi:transposase InsO family protein
VDQHKEEHGLNRCLEAIGLPKSTYYYRKNRPDKPSEEDQKLMDNVREIIQEHPQGVPTTVTDGSCRSLRSGPARRSTTGRLRRLLSEHELGLARQASKHSPSPVQEILGETAGDLNLVAGQDPGPLKAFSTDFTEVAYAGGDRKAYLMAVVDLESKYVPGWAVGPSANRDLAMRCWEQVRERMASLGEGLDEKIIHHDLDSVYTSYRWLEAILLGDEMRVSYSENGAKGNPWIESLWGRMKDEIGSRITEASSLPALRSVFDERFRYYNQERRHSSIGYIPPREHLGQTLDTLELEPQIAAVS